MVRKNFALDKIDEIQNELDRLYSRIPEDTSAQDDLYLRIVRGLKNSLEALQNLIELEDDD
jgi:hypothetical protein|tara:strand:+ start:85 stop:267 length:183 start_codon:yes stop_codon:yes gene_type:complete